MRKLCLAALASAAALSAAPAQAASFISFTPNNGTIPAYIGSGLVFNQDFGTGAVNNTPYVATGAESVSGNVRLYSTSQSGVAQKPATGEGNFLAVLGGSYQIAFSSGVSVLSFIAGSIDPYNSVVLKFANGTSQTLRGQAIVGLTPTGIRSIPQETGRVTYDFGGGPQLTSISFNSTGRSFEIDGIIAAAPEPAAWLMMILGFGLIGGSLRRLRAQGKLALA